MSHPRGTNMGLRTVGLLMLTAVVVFLSVCTIDAWYEWGHGITHAPQVR